MANTKSEDGDIAETEDVAKKITRDDIRSQIFSAENTELKKVPLPFNGTMLEFHQPSVGDADKLRSAAGDNPDDNFLVRALIAFTYVPVTDELVFSA